MGVFIGVAIIIFVSSYLFSAAADGANKLYSSAAGAATTYQNAADNFKLAAEAFKIAADKLAAHG